MLKSQIVIKVPGLIVFFFCSLISPLWATQHFTCFPPDITSSDRVVISLSDTVTGTLFLTSGIDDDGNQENSGVLPLKKEKDETYVTIWKSNNASSEFTVIIPKDVIGASTDNASLLLVLKNNEREITQNLNCYSRIYE